MRVVDTQANAIEHNHWPWPPGWPPTRKARLQPAVLVANSKSDEDSTVTNNLQGGEATKDKDLDITAIFQLKAPRIRELLREAISIEFANVLRSLPPPPTLASPPPPSLPPPPPPIQPMIFYMTNIVCPPLLPASTHSGGFLSTCTHIGDNLRAHQPKPLKRKIGQRGRDKQKRKKRRCGWCLANGGSESGICRGRLPGRGRAACKFFDTDGKRR